MKLIIAFLVFWACFLSCQSEDINIYAQHVKEISKDKDGWKLIWSDEFEQESNIPNEKIWSLPKKESSPWNRYMSESYDHAYVKDGKLYLIAEKKGDQYLTGGVETENKINFKYGKLEICAKFNSFQGGWSAIWLMPQERQYPLVDNNYPGEIDILEQVSLDKIAQHSVHTHYTLDLGYDKNPPRNGYGEYRDGEFNLYGIEWTPEKIIFTVNGEETFSYPNLHLANEALMQQWPFDVPYYLIMNYSLGGENTWPGPIDDKGLPGHMEVEYVRYYEKESNNDSGGEEEVVEELIKNGDFEESFAAGKQPGIFNSGMTDQNNILGYLNHWFCKPNAVNPSLTVDNNEGYESYCSLKYAASAVNNAWETDLSYALQGVKPGKYTFSYLVKTNQEDSPFTVSVIICETSDELGLQLTKQKVIVINPKDGSQVITTEPSWDNAATAIYHIGKEWTPCTLTLDIPKNVLIRFLYKPCAGENNNQYDIYPKPTQNVVYWFDNFALTSVKE